MDLQFGLIFWLIIGVAMFERAVRVDRKLSIADRIQHFLKRSQQQGTLGPPRLERHQSRLYVVGYGQCQPVRSRQQGERLIARMQADASGIVSALKPAGQEGDDSQAKRVAATDASLKFHAARSRNPAKVKKTPPSRNAKPSSSPAKNGSIRANPTFVQPLGSSQRLWRYGVRSNPTSNREVPV